MMKVLVSPQPVSWVLAILLLAASPQGQPAASVEPINPLLVDPATQDFSQNPALLERIVASPHGYLRFINIPFSREVCRRAGHLLGGVPIFNLHGDAHVEQYAVTDLGRGLTDFDDSSRGPAVIDIMRLSVSLRLASQLNGWPEEADAIIDRFLAGYRDVLEDPAAEAPMPPVAVRLAADFKFDRDQYFDWVESIADPVPADEAEDLIEAMSPYIALMHAQHPELDSRYFEIVEVGYLRLGIGSALDRKYLVRIRGAGDQGVDDVVLELKQVRDLQAIECISVGTGNEPLRILIGQSLIAYQPYGLLGYVVFDDLTFWVHAWVDNYAETSVVESFQSPEEIGEVAYDIGLQLGRGHPNQIAANLDLQIRQSLLRVLARDEGEIKEVGRELTSMVNQAWEDFRAAFD
jgi:hypothetical protein